MKKLLLVLTLLLTLALLVACGSNETTGDENNAGTEEDNTTTQPSEKPDKDEASGDHPIPFGFYNITNKSGKLLGAPETTGQPITFGVSDTKTLTAEEANTWTIEPKIAADGSAVYVLFCTYDPKNVASPAALLPGRGLERGNYDCDANDATKQWIITKNEDGTFQIVNKKVERFCLVTDAKGNAVLADKDNLPADVDPNWTITEKTEFTEFETWYSKDRTMIFQLPVGIEKKADITSDRIQQWAEDAAAMRKTYIEFTGFNTYDHMILKAYETEKHIAYVVSKYLCITSDKDFIVADLARMSERTTKHKVHDINFMMLHEMGHMYDRKHQWNFEGEAMTDIKAAYVLYKNPDCVAAPSEYEPREYFDYKTITKAYTGLGGTKMDGGSYSIYCCAALFVDYIQNQIKDWDKVKDMYHWYVDNHDSIDPVAWYKNKKGLGEKDQVALHVARLELYMDKLTEYGGVPAGLHIKGDNYTSIYKKCNGEFK